MTAYFEFWPTTRMSSYDFEARIKHHVRGVKLKQWSRQINKTIYQATATRPEDFILLGQAIQIILDEIIPHETGKDTTGQSHPQTPTGGRLTR